MIFYESKTDKMYKLIFAVNNDCKGELYAWIMGRKGGFGAFQRG